MRERVGLRIADTFTLLSTKPHMLAERPESIILFPYNTTVIKHFPSHTHPSTSTNAASSCQPPDAALSQRAGEHSGVISSRRRIVIRAGRESTEVPDIRTVLSLNGAVRYGGRGAAISHLGYATST